MSRARWSSAHRGTVRSRLVAAIATVGSIALAAGLGYVGGQASRSPRTVPVSADTYAVSWLPTAVEGQSRFLAAGGFDGGAAVTYLKFHITLPPGKTPTRAELWLARHSGKLPELVELSSVPATGWVETALNAANAPLLGATIASVATAGYESAVRFVITRVIKQSGWYAFAVTAPTGNAVAHFVAKDDSESGKAPTITLTFDDPSASPTPGETSSPWPSDSPSPSDVPTDTPTPLPSDGAGESPTAAPAETPSATPVDPPSESPWTPPPAADPSPSETPADPPSESPSGTPGETPSGAPSDTPSETPSETPTESPSALPGETPSETPSALPGETPSETPAVPSPTPDEPSPSPSGTPADPRCGVDVVLVPQCGVMWGVAPGGHTDLSRSEALTSFETTTGRQQALLHSYHRGNQLFPTAEEISLARNGGSPRVLFVNWKPSGYTWAEIAAGYDDAYLDSLARYIEAYFPERFFFTMHHEPEDDVVERTGSGMMASDFAAAFRHVVTHLRERGVTNLVSVVCYMAYVPWNVKPWFEDLYPGDDVVDWVSWDAYAYSDPGYGYGDFAEMMNRRSGNRPGWPGFYNWAATHFPDKPLMVAEWGVWYSDRDPNHQAEFFDSVARQMQLFPRVKAMVYFDTPRQQQGRDSRVTATTEGLAAYRRLSLSPVFSVMPDRSEVMPEASRPARGD